MKIYLLALLLTAGCKSKKSEPVPVLQKDTTTKDVLPSTGSIADTSMKALTKQAEIMGIWTIETKEPITVEINQDSIYYTEHFESHPYKLKGDSILINYPNFILAAKVYFYGDTLVMKSDEGEAKFVRFHR